jgi:hypothetical protein
MQDKIDKYVNTYETDTEFLLFKQSVDGSSAPIPAHTSSSSSATQQRLEEKLKSNPLLQFLREKAERRLRNKKGTLSLNRDAAGDTPSKKEKSGKSKTAKKKAKKEERAMEEGGGPGTGLTEKKVGLHAPPR